MEWNREPRNKHTHIYSINLWQGYQDQWSLQQNGTGKTGNPHIETWNRTLPYTITQKSSQ